MTKSTRLVLVALVAGLSLLPAAAFATAATSDASQTCTATVANAASLTLGTTTVTFPSADPGSESSIPANENGTITVTADLRTGDASTATLTVYATQDLTDSSSDTIAADNITWTVTNTSGSGLVAGTMAQGSTNAVSMGSWTGSGEYAGTLNYFLANSYLYQTGSYTTTLDYTLTAP